MGSDTDRKFMEDWRVSPFRPLFGGREFDSDDEDILPGFHIPPPCYSTSELKHMNKYTDLKSKTGVRFPAVWRPRFSNPSLGYLCMCINAPFRCAAPDIVYDDYPAEWYNPASYV